MVTIPLLETKLQAPRRRPGVVDRARLRDRLGRGREAAVTLVSAPAGFGKTTAVAEWLAATPVQGRATAWLSLDERDDDPVLFWSYVVAALRTAVPGIGAEALDLLRSGGAPPIEAVVASLLNELNALPDDVVLVLDDYHVLDSTELHGAMAYLIEHRPPRLHLVLTTRADPPLPLARLRARGDVVEVRAADLRFTADETAAYLHGSMGLDMARDDLDALGARTEGWIAALQLAALSLQGRDDVAVAGFVASFAGDDRFVVDYLVEEVLERQSAEVRRFLLATALLDRLTGPLCDALTGGGGGKAMLERLDRANLFVVPLDDRRLWYRYHHLFADVLRARLLDEQPDAVPELHRRASAWYEAHGDQAEAIAHALAGGHVDRAAQLVELAAPALRQARQEATLRRWLEALPGDIFADRPVLSIALVGARMATGDATGVEPLVRNAERWLDAAGAGDGSGSAGPAPIVFDEDELARLPAQVAVYRAALALLDGDLAATVAHADRALDLIDPADHLRRGSATALQGLAHWAVGHLGPAGRCYAEAVRCFEQAGFLPDVLGCSLALADIQMAEGRLRDALATFGSGLDHARRHPGLRGAADMHVGRSEVLLDRHDLDGAERHLDAAAALGEHAGLPQNAYRSRVAAGRLRLARGDPDGALALFHEAEKVYDTDFSPAVRPIPALRARVRLAQGDVAAALRWAGDRGLTATDDLAYVHEFEHVTLARTLLARPDADHPLADTVALLDRLFAAAEAGHREGSAIEVLVLLSLAREVQGDRPAAVAALEEALRRAAPEGHLRVFVDVAPALAGLLRGVAPHGPTGELARRALAAAAGRTASSPSSRGLVDPLSDRELDVLRLLRSELSGPDIARELVISLNTLRTHTKNIYAKLGVNSRRGALRRAAELGL